MRIKNIFFVCISLALAIFPVQGNDDFLIPSTPVSFDASLSSIIYEKKIFEHFKDGFPCLIYCLSRPENKNESLISIRSTEKGGFELIFIEAENLKQAYLNQVELPAARSKSIAVKNSKNIQKLIVHLREVIQTPKYDRQVVPINGTRSNFGYYGVTQHDLNNLNEQLATNFFAYQIDPEKQSCSGKIIEIMSLIKSLVVEELTYEEFEIKLSDEIKNLDSLIKRRSVP
jgi:hypothetical protein